ncbi:hypothetical protein EGX66_26500, partial [Escherichia coli]|nr:hypothetical protein [Escherichia coli]
TNRHGPLQKSIGITNITFVQTIKHKQQMIFLPEKKLKYNRTLSYWGTLKIHLIRRRSFIFITRRFI